MVMYRIKRNNSFHVILIIILIIALITIFSPIKSKTITDLEEYTVEEEKINQKSIKTIEEKITNISINNRTTVSTNMNYTLEFDDDIYRTTLGSSKFANQDFILVLEKKDTFCVEYEYEFFDDDVEVNDEEGEVCFKNSKIEDFTLKELYVGDVDDHYYVITITKLPQITKEIVSTYNVPVLENSSVITYMNITELVNITKTREINKTIRTWMFG